MTANTYAPDDYSGKKQRERSDSLGCIVHTYTNKHKDSGAPQTQHTPRNKKYTHALHLTGRTINNSQHGSTIFYEQLQPQHTEL